VSLGWPVAVQQTLTTLMRTVDILVTGFFLRRRSPRSASQTSTPESRSEW
jgi:hypothetical protein